MLMWKQMIIVPIKILIMYVIINKIVRLQILILNRHIIIIKCA